MEQSQTLHNAFKRFTNGDELHAYSYMGCHPEERDGIQGFVFRVWAPHARSVSVVGDWNFWNPEDLPMEHLEYGIWEAFSAFARQGNGYKFYIVCEDSTAIYRADPFAFERCPGPEHSGRIRVIEGYEWGDEAYRRQQGKRKLLDSPMNIYKVDPASWKKGEDGAALSCRELARELIPYVKDMGYTHLELLPVAEHLPRQSFRLTAFYAPAVGFGSPQDFMSFVDQCHQAGLGVLLDWEALCFPKGEQGLERFDGGCCYEGADTLMNELSDHSAYLFDYSKPEVQSFLISNGVYWMEQYHVDGLRAESVTTMLYLDYDRREFHPNIYGGKENLDAIAFLRKLNRAVFSSRRNAITIAEEYTAFPLVTKPDYDGGLGFLYKWNKGWLQSMLRYFRLDPLWRKGSHELLSEPMDYAYAENFVLPLHHGAAEPEGSLIAMLPGDYEDKFACLRAFYGLFMAYPGKKLSFMGNELAQFSPWNPEGELDWFLLDYEKHRLLRDYVRELNKLYLRDCCLWNNDSDWGGFQWISRDDCDNSVIAFRRIDRRSREIIAIFNFCPVLRQDYRLGLPRSGEYEPVLSSDERFFGGSGQSLAVVSAKKEPMHDLPFSGEFTLPPLSAVFYKRKVLPKKRDEE